MAAFKRDDRNWVHRRRKSLYKTQKNCYYCNSRLSLISNNANNMATVEHIYPVYDIRQPLIDKLDNTVLACYACNRKRNTEQLIEIGDKCQDTRLHDGMLRILLERPILPSFILSIMLLLTLTVSAQVQLYQYKAEVTKVIDGDTFISRVELGFDVMKNVTIRLAKINAPEMKGPDSIAASKAKDYLTRKLLGKTIYFSSKAYDKYHRSIAIVYLSATDTATVNNDLVRKGFAKYQSY